MIDYKDEPELLDRLSKDDESAFRKIYERYFHVLYLTALYFLHNEEDAEDVVQEVFTDLWRKRHIANTIRMLKPYLTKTCRNITQKRKNEKDKLSPFDEISHEVSGSTTDEAVIERELKHQDRLSKFEKNLEKIGEKKCAKVYKKVKLDGYKPKDVAQSENISLDTVKQHIKTVTAYLKQQCQKK